MCVLQLFVFQDITLKILKLLALSNLSNQAVFLRD